MNSPKSTTSDSRKSTIDELRMKVRNFFRWFTCRDRILLESRTRVGCIEIIERIYKDK